MGSILGIWTKSIQAKAYGQKKGKIEVKTTIPKIQDLVLIEMKRIEKKVLSLAYEYESRYFSEQEEIGRIALEGELLFLAEEPEKIKELWDKERKIPEDIATPVLNSILAHCTKRAITLSEEVRLPPPINFPVVKKEKK